MQIAFQLSRTSRLKNVTPLCYKRVYTLTLRPQDPAGRFIVLYTFIARDENDVSVERGEFVTVLNQEDPDWFWVVRSDGQEGFVPSGFVYAADVIQGKTQRKLKYYLKGKIIEEPYTV